MQVAGVDIGDPHESDVEAKTDDDCADESKYRPESGVSCKFESDSEDNAGVTMLIDEYIVTLTDQRSTLIPVALRAVPLRV